MGVAAYGVIANLSLVVISIFTGIAQGMQPLISSAYGRGDSARIRGILRYGLAAAVFISLTLYAGICWGAAPITAVFNSENNLKLQEIAEYGLRLYFTGIPAAGLNIILSIFFTSTEQAVPAHIISLLKGPGAHHSHSVFHVRPLGNDRCLAGFSCDGAGLCTDRRCHL